MQFSISKSGSVTDCREELNTKIAELPLPYDTKHAVVRAIANHIVVDYLDPLHDPWEEKNNKLRASGLSASEIKSANPEPSASISVSLNISLGNDS
jgi:hypothetical protein